MAYKVIILYRLYMPSYVLGTFTEYPYVKGKKAIKKQHVIRGKHQHLLYNNSRCFLKICTKK